MPDKDNQGTPIQGEVNPVEEKARAGGWKPLDEWEGEETDWIDAKEFVGRQPLFDKIKDLKGDVKGLQKDFNFISRHFQTVKEEAYQNALRDLQDQRKQAAKEGDTEAVVDLSDKIDDLKQEKQKTPTPTPEVPREFTSWVEKNSWYQNDADLRTEADAIGIGFRSKYPDATLDEMLDFVATKVKKVNPEKFPQKRTASNATVEGTTNAPRKKVGGFTKADLSETERQVMATFVKRGTMTEAEYIESYQKRYGGK